MGGVDNRYFPSGEAADTSAASPERLDQHQVVKKYLETMKGKSPFGSRRSFSLDESLCVCVCVMYGHANDASFFSINLCLLDLRRYKRRRSLGARRACLSTSRSLFLSLFFRASEDLLKDIYSVYSDIPQCVSSKCELRYQGCTNEMTRRKLHNYLNSNTNLRHFNSNMFTTYTSGEVFLEYIIIEPCGLTTRHNHVVSLNLQYNYMSKNTYWFVLLLKCLCSRRKEIQS